jgi:Icc-related predicted phosphoesterase
MRIVALTDIHGAYGTVERILRQETPDVLVVGGDLTSVGTVKEADDAIRSFRSLGPTVVCVAGNMDLPGHDKLFEQLGVSINGRGIIIDGVGFFGVSAAPLSPLKTPNEIPEDEIARSAVIGFLEVKDARLKVFVPHAPPYGTRLDITHSGIHVGSTAVRDFIEDNQPDVVICGHIHEGRGQDVLGVSRIVNCGPASKGFFARITLQEHRITELSNL